MTDVALGLSFAARATGVRSTAAAPSNSPADVAKAAYRASAARLLGSERRRVYLWSMALAVAAPAILYVSGASEWAWYGMAATGWPLTLRAALFLGAFHLALAVVLMPLTVYGTLLLPTAFGLSRQTPSSWLADWVKATGLSVMMGTLLGGSFLWASARFGDAWWLVLGALISALSILLVFITPYVLVPIFFKMQRLADEAAVERITALAERAGARVSEVCTLDFSRRTMEANAAVIGLGRSRRVVLADTLLAEFEPDEIDAVVAHELAHHVHRDVPRLLSAQLAIVWVGLALAGWAIPSVQPVLSLPWPGYVPAYPEVFALAQLYLALTAPLANWLSRQRERAADEFALRLIERPAAFASAMRRLASQNLIELHPPRWAEVLLASHPGLHRRLAMAERAGAAAGAS